MSVRMETRLWLAQRTAGAVLGLCVIVHLATMVVAVQGGLTAAEISARVTSNGLWFAFYTVFVLAAAVHAPIGLRTMLGEMTALSKARVDLLAFLFAAFLLVAGLRVVFGFFTLAGAA